MLAASYCSGYPISDKRDTDTVSPEVEEGDDMYERLKLGDREAWEKLGPTVVDAVYEMIEEGVARSPVHALLILFWPDSTKTDHERILARVEPLLQNSYDDFFAALNSTPETNDDDEEDSTPSSYFISSSPLSNTEEGGLTETVK